MIPIINFTISEMTNSPTAKRMGIDNSPSLSALQSIIVTMAMLQRIRDVLKVSVIVSSGYRSPRLNAVVGGVLNSDHTLGHAADFIAPKYGTPFQVASKLSLMVVELGIGQLIYEGFSNRQWVHVSTKEPLKKANKIITISGSGVLSGIQEV